MRLRPLTLVLLLLAPLTVSDASAVPAPATTPATTAPAVEVGPTYLPSTVYLRKSPGGTSIVRGKGPIVGTRGKLVRYTIEVQTSMPNRAPRAVELEAVARWVFGDAARGWTARGRFRFQRVGTVKEAKLRILMAKPSEVDRRCRQGGANTDGKYSCHNGYGVVALNNLRWQRGPIKSRFPSLDEYRAYLVNHEVGHGIGYAHRKCARKGALAHVMVPQSRVTYGCRANGWPYP